jgi:beta-1,4-N-acetylglucosaminyltransferase
MNPRKPTQKPPGTPLRLMVVLGSGGHTTEMFYLLKGMDKSSYSRRSYVVTKGDNFSAKKALQFENELDANLQKKEQAHIQQHSTDNTAKEEITTPKRTRGFDVTTLPRPRKVHEGSVTAVFNTLQSINASITALYGNSNKKLRETYGPNPHYPDVIVCNGPGIAVCVVLGVLWLRFWGRRGIENTRTIYVESFARVKTLSLTGKILKRLVDCFIVQWQELAERVGGEYYGSFVFDAVVNESAMT